MFSKSRKVRKNNTKNNIKSAEITKSKKKMPKRKRKFSKKSYYNKSCEGRKIFGSKRERHKKQIQWGVTGCGCCDIISFDKISILTRGVTGGGCGDIISFGKIW